MFKVLFVILSGFKTPFFIRFLKWLKIEEINRILNKGNLSDEVVRILTNVFKYLEAHADHINYDHYKSLGLPIG
ncbi:MAG: hypothetical protein OMM_12810, partial [Candidatus Magnetoglobus multicellularis str. Araruama]